MFAFINLKLLKRIICNITTPRVSKVWVVQKSV